MSKRQKKQAQPEEHGATTPPPAYFLSVTVENVRCFGEAQTLDLSDGNGRPAQWTVILGDNGTGKTTLLQAIAMLEAMPQEFIVPEIGEKVVVPRSFTSGLQLFNWKPYRSIDGYLNLDSSLFIGSKLANSSDGYVVKGWKAEKWFEESGKRSRGKATTEAFKDIGALQCYSYGASRHMAKTRLAEDEVDDPTASLFADDVALPNAEEWLLKTYLASLQASAKTVKDRLERRLKQIKAVLIPLLPDVDSIRFTETADPSDVTRVEFETPYGWVTIDQLGLGYRTMIAWMVDLARRLFERYPDSSNPLAEPAVVLVDEIDLHLHPQWQRNLIQFLSERFPNTQFIVTAHSPLVVQAAADANIVLLRREGDHVVIENDLKAIRNWRIDQILTSDLFGLESARSPHLDGLLKQRREILSKGTFTEADRKELEELEAQIGELPTGETPEDIKAMDVIRRAAAWLEKNPDAVYDSD